MTSLINPLMANEFTHHYHLGVSILSYGDIRCDLRLVSFFCEILLCKQNSFTWDAAFCGVTSGAIYCLPMFNDK